MDREDQLQLPQVRFDRRLHVRVLQLAGKITPVMGAGAMNLAERSSRSRVMLEARELLLPAGAELRAHAALDEGPAHGRRLALQLHQLGCVFRRQGIGDGGHELGHLHDRALEAPERRRELGRVLAAVEREPEQPRPGEARGDAAHIGPDARVAGGAGGETVGFAIGHCISRLRSPQAVHRQHRHLRTQRQLRPAILGVIACERSPFRTGPMPRRRAARWRGTTRAA